MNCMFGVDDGRIDVSSTYLFSCGEVTCSVSELLRNVIPVHAASADTSRCHDERDVGALVGVVHHNMLEWNREPTEPSPLVSD